MNKKQKFNKALLLPIVSAVALLVKTATGYEIGDELINALVDGIIAGGAIAGIFMKPKK